MAHEILTPCQERFLELFFGDPAAQGFLLGGGTALSAFYLKHRLSEDLDLFARVAPGPEAREAIDRGEDLVRRIADAEGASLILSKRLPPAFYRAVLSWPGANPEDVKIDVVADIPISLGPPRLVEGVRVDSLQDLAAGKLQAITDRRPADLRSRGEQEAKDFVDVYFLVEERGFSIRDLVNLYQRKNRGLDDLAIAAALRHVEEITSLPLLRMKKSVDLLALRDRFLAMSDELARPYREP